MAETEKKEHAQTQKMLDQLTKWGKNPNIDGGESVAFSLSRQGAPSDAFLVTGDCTPFTASGKRGTLNGQPSGFTGAPFAYYVDFSGSSPVVKQIPCTFAFDLNKSKVSIGGAFPGLASTLDFTVEYIRSFDGAGGENLLFHSEKTSDDAGYILAVELVGAS